LLGEQLDEIVRLDQAIGRIETKLEELYRPFDRQLERLRTIPGVHVQTARVILAEIGVDMKRFPTAGHLASWAGMCPGNRESGGKRQSGRSRPGNEWLRSALTEAGWAAARSKGTALGSFFQRIARRRGGKRACRAVGHQILRLAHRLLSNPDESFREPGPDYFDQRRKDQLANALLRKLRQLGVDVSVKEPAA
jgi:transposase